MIYLFTLFFKNSMKSTPLPAGTLLLVAAIVMIWGSSFPIIKIVLQEIPPLTFRAVIAPFGIIVLVAIALISRKSVPRPQGQWKQLALTSIFNITGWFTLSALGISLMRSGHASIIAFTMPFWASLFSMWFIGETPTLRRILGLGLGLAGIAVLLLSKFSEIDFSPLGLLFMFGAAISWGIGTALQKKIAWKIPSLFVVLWQLVIGGLPIMVASFFFEAGKLEPISPQAFMLLLYILLVPILFNWYAWFKIVSILPVTVASVSTLMVPVIGVITSNLVLGESLGFYEFGALVLVCSGLALVLIPKKTNKFL